MLSKIMLAVVVVAALAGCESDAGNHMKCRDNVVKDIGSTDVVEIKPYKFVARDAKGTIWYYETMSLSGPQITAKNPVLAAK